MSKKQARNTQPAKPAGMKKLEHRGFTIVQSPRNHHIMIGKDGRMVYHAHYDHHLTDEELRQRVDDYITLSASLTQPTGGVAVAGPATKRRQTPARNGGTNER